MPESRRKLNRIGIGERRSQQSQHDCGNKFGKLHAIKYATRFARLKARIAPHYEVLILHAGDSHAVMPFQANLLQDDRFEIWVFGKRLIKRGSTDCIRINR